MLDYDALRKMAHQKAKSGSELMYPDHEKEMREKAFRDLALKYFHEYVTHTLFSKR